jgi:putative hemolysin
LFGQLTQTAADVAREDAGGGRFNPFRLADLVRTGGPASLDTAVAGLIEQALGLSRLASEYERVAPGAAPVEFAGNVLDYLGIEPQIAGGNLDNIPAEGPCIVVANHPFGGIEGFLAAHLVGRRRADVRIMANGMLKRVPEMADIFIAVNPYGTGEAVKDNLKPMREALRWLQQGGLLVVFPAGDVSQLNLRKLRIADGPWQDLVARLAARTDAAIVPVYFGGRNSWRFHLLGKLHPRLRTVLLPRELLNKRRAALKVWIGESIPFQRLRGLGSNAEITRYLRLRTLMLRDVDANSRLLRGLPTVAEMAAASGEQVVAPIDPVRLVEEIAALPAERKLATSGELDVYYARSREIPALLQEIGRLRELTFRAVGEGTGRAVDIDLYDNHYLQLFIWDRVARRIAGAYRLGLSDQIMDRYGCRGFYSHSLFKYRSPFIRALGPSIEMGRSFVAADYQKSFAPLMLLWKGIGTFVARHPRYATLFGPVSISADYTSLSQQLLIHFLEANNFDTGLGRQVRARRPWRPSLPHAIRLKPVWRKTDLAGMQSIQGISELVSLIEGDDKGAPVLIKQYLKMGGRMLGFNVDQAFSDCVDGLMVADLRRTDPKVLKRYMGADGADAFLAFHAADGLAEADARRAG